MLQTKDRNTIVIDQPFQSSSKKNVDCNLKRKSYSEDDKRICFRNGKSEALQDSTTNQHITTRQRVPLCVVKRVR